MKKFLALMLALLMALSLVACGSGSAAGGSTTLVMGTGGESGTYYAFGGVIAGKVSEVVPDLKINYVSSGGSSENLQNIAAGTVQLATVQSDVMTYAYEGTNTFEKSGDINSFRVLCAMYAETVQIVTTNPDIKSVADLKGKSVCVGDTGSGTYYNTVDVLAAYDMTIDDITPIYQSFGDSTESLQDGKIDAAFLCAGAPTTAVATLDSAKQIYLLSIDDEHMSKLLTACPYYASYTIPADTYGTVTTDTQTITVKATLICSASLTDDQAYNIVSAIFSNTDSISAAHKKGEELDTVFATDGIAVPFHTGAAKYFAEQGITVSAE
jgi:TRAP transporter TAXI family solute receptor